MTQSFFIPMVLPNLNDMLAAAKQGRRGYQPYARMKSECELVIRNAIARHRLRAMVQPVEIYFTWREENKRRDLDNICAARKFAIDSLVKSGILSNDGWAQVRGFHDEFCVNTKEPGVFVMLKPYSYCKEYVGTSTHQEPV